MTDQPTTPPAQSAAGTPPVSAAAAPAPQASQPHSPWPALLGAAAALQRHLRETS